MIHFAGLAPADLPDIENLLDARFGPARRNRTAYRLRDGVGPIAALSLVARDGGVLVGSLQCWPLQLRSAGQIHALILLGPVAVAAERQGEGIATALMTRALAAIDAAAAPSVLLIGDAPFYGRFGFEAGVAAHWLVPGPVDRARLLVRCPVFHKDALPEHGTLEPGAPHLAAA